MKIFNAIVITLIFVFYPATILADGTTLSVTILGDTQCIDGIDNDSDGLVDYPNDSGCSSFSDDDETDPVSPSPTVGTGGGGGGGGGGIITPTSVIFKGLAYPDSDVTLFQDAKVVATTKAGDAAKFEISLSGVSTGTHTFGVWAEDKQGIHSIVRTFTIAVSSGVTTVVSDIFLPPTIWADKTEVRHGDPLIFIGYSVPSADVALLINSEEELVKKIVADDAGLWVYKFDTLEVEYGNHTAHTRANTEIDISNFSKTVNFIVGTENVAALKLSLKAEKGDMNNDERVDISDFSIMAFWYGRQSPPVTIDLNDDGAVTLTDFSILAFYWTG